MTKVKIEEGMEKYQLVIQDLGEALKIFDDSAPESKYEVRRSLARGTWTVRTPSGKKVMVLRQRKGASIPVIGDPSDSIGKYRRRMKALKK